MRSLLLLLLAIGFTHAEEEVISSQKANELMREHPSARIELDSLILNGKTFFIDQGPHFPGTTISVTNESMTSFINSNPANIESIIFSSDGSVYLSLYGKYSLRTSEPPSEVLSKSIELLCKRTTVSISKP